jgi:hypothetical protein
VGRNTTIYKFDEEKVRNLLYPKLTSDSKFKKSFFNFISDRSKEFGDKYKIFYESIIKTVYTNVNLIRPSELFEIEIWFFEFVCSSFNDCNETLKQNGVELICELSSTNAYSFMFQYANYTDFHEIDGLNEGNQGKSLKAPDFILFLNYFILLLNKLNNLAENHELVDLTFEYYDLETQQIQEIKSTSENNKPLNDFINHQFDLLISWWRDYKLLESKPSRRDRDIDPGTYTVLHADYFSSICFQMKNVIKNDDQSIVIVDSL